MDWLTVFLTVTTYSPGGDINVYLFNGGQIGVDVVALFIDDQPYTFTPVDPEARHLDVHDLLLITVTGAFPAEGHLSVVTQRGNSFDIYYTQ
jgi:hypothetical protein